MMANSTETIIMDALSSLSSPHLSHLSGVSRRHLRRLVSVLSSPILFSLTLRRLQSLSLHHKSLLIARHLFSNLTFLKNSIQNPAVAAPPPPCVKIQDLDAVLLLLLLCELHQHDLGFLDTPPSWWRPVLSDYASNSILRTSSLGGCSLIQFVECVVRCWNLVNVMGCGGGGKAAAVVALPSVEVGEGEECVICREEMRKGRDVCELACKHLFHWVCILRWFKKRNTCPCCRRRLPTDDLRREIERLLEELAVIGGGGDRLHRDCLYDFFSFKFMLISSKINDDID